MDYEALGIAAFYAGKPITFDDQERALCVNGHGPMDMRPLEGTFLVPEARARCQECRHTMIVADER